MLINKKILLLLFSVFLVASACTLIKKASQTLSNNSGTLWSISQEEAMLQLPSGPVEVSVTIPHGGKATIEWGSTTIGSYSTYVVYKKCWYNLFWQEIGRVRSEDEKKRYQFETKYQQNFSNHWVLSE